MLLGLYQDAVNFTESQRVCWRPCWDSSQFSPGFPPLNVRVLSETPNHSASCYLFLSPGGQDSDYLCPLTEQPSSPPLRAVLPQAPKTQPSPCHCLLLIFFAAQEASMGNSQSIFTVRKLAKQTQNVHSNSRSSYGHGSWSLGHSPPLLSLSLGFTSPLTLLCPMKCHKPLPPPQSLFLWQSGEPAITPSTKWAILGPFLLKEK